jgi:CRP-like cAMP-binding protein
MKLSYGGSGAYMRINREEFKERFSKLVGELQPVEIDALMSIMGSAQLPKGKTLLTCDQESDTLYLIWKGKLSILLESNDTVLTMAEVTSGKWVGETSIIDPGPVSATVRAVEDCTLFLLSHRDFKRFSQERPRAVAAMLRVFSRDLAATVRDSTSGLIKYNSNGKLVLQRSPEQEGPGLVRLLARLFGIRED